jgi:DNA-binding transcriptional LysR family regulator
MLGFAHLEALIAIAESGSFRAAAERLNVTQPTVSMRIRELEQTLGTRLFDRSSYRPQLTADGREALKYAQRMMVLMRDMRAATLGGEGLSGTIRLGAADTFALTCLPALLARLEHRFPRLRVALDIDHSIRLNQRLRRGELDIAFLTAPPPGPDLAIEELVPIELVWVASPRLGLPRGGVAPADLADVPVITNPEPSNLYASAMGWFGGAGIEPQRLSTCSSLTYMVHLAAAGVAASLLPVAILRPEIESGVLHAFPARPAIAPHTLAMARRSGLALPDLAVVEELAREVVARSALLVSD